MRTHATLWLSLVVCLPISLFGEVVASPDSLAKTALTAIAAKDEPALRALGINQAEYKKYVWPKVNSASAGKSPDFDKSYASFTQISDQGLRQLLADFGGQKLELVRVTVGPEDKHKGYRFLPSPELVVRTAAGQEQTVRLGSAFIEHDGALQVENYFARPKPAQK